MSGMRYLTNEEINFITKDIKGKKSEIKNILRSKVKVYKLNKRELGKIKKRVESYTNEKNIPKYITEDEADYILQDLPEIPSCIKDVREFNRLQIIENLKFDLQTFKICKDKQSLEKIKRIIHETYIRSLCQPGDAVGSNGAMSLGQAMTQANLDAFHTSGSGNSKEEEMRNIDMLLYPTTKKVVESCNVHLRDKNLTKEEILKSYQKRFKGISVQDLIISSEILSEVPEEDYERYHNYFTVFNTKIKTTNNFMRLRINVFKCYIYDIQIKDVCNVLEKTTRTRTGKKSIHCISTSTYQGIIDIHVEEEFISESIQEFISKGSTFKGCEKKYRGKTSAVAPGEQKTYLKTVLDLDTDINDLISIFMKVILETCFKDMNIAGIPGVENISVIDHRLSGYLKFRKIYDDRDVLKYTSSPFNVEPNGYYRLYYVYIDYFALNIIGIPKDKFIKYLELCGMEFLEDNTSSSKPHCVFLLPEVPDTLITEDNLKELEEKYG